MSATPPTPPIADCRRCQALLEAIAAAEALSREAVERTREGRGRALMIRVRNGLATVLKEALEGTLVEDQP